MMVEPRMIVSSAYSKSESGSCSLSQTLLIMVVRQWMMASPPDLKNSREIMQTPNAFLGEAF